MKVNSCHIPHGPVHSVVSSFALGLRLSVSFLIIPSPLGSVPRPKAARRGMERPRVEEKGGYDRKAGTNRILRRLSSYPVPYRILPV